MAEEETAKCHRIGPMRAVPEVLEVLAVAAETQTHQVVAARRPRGQQAIRGTSRTLLTRRSHTRGGRVRMPQ